MTKIKWDILTIEVAKPGVKITEKPVTILLSLGFFRRTRWKQQQTNFNSVIPPGKINQILSPVTGNAGSWTTAPSGLTVMTAICYYFHRVWNQLGQPMWAVSNLNVYQLILSSNQRAKICHFFRMKQQFYKTGASRFSM